MSLAGRSSPHLSDIMAAFNIPDQGDLPIQYSPLKGNPPSTATAPANGAAKSPGLATPSTGSQIIPVSLQQHGHPSGSTPVLGLDRSSGSSASGSYQSDDLHPNYHYPQESANAYSPKQLQDQFLVYSKEDWPSPEFTGSPQENNPDMFQEGSSQPSMSYAGMESGSTGPRRSRRRQARAKISQVSVRQKRNKERMRRLRQERTMDPEHLADRIKSKEYDPFKAFRCVMTEEHKRMISCGMSDEQKIVLLRELQESVKRKQREAMRARRARLTPEQMEKERRRNRERKKKRRLDPIIEFRRYMTEEQRRQLMQPDLDPEIRQRILTELNAVKKWVHREQTRKRRAHLSYQQREDVRKRSREYKRRARSNPMQAFKCVMTERHYELLQQDLSGEQKEGLMQELIELKKAKQRHDMRSRRAAFSPEQKERERTYSRRYKRAHREKTIADLLYRSAETSPAPEVSEFLQVSVVPAVPITTDAVQAMMEGQEHSPPLESSASTYAYEANQELNIQNELMTNEETEGKGSGQKLRNRERQRIRRSMQTPDEREDERRKNRDRSRARRKKAAEAAGRIFQPRWNAVDSGKKKKKVVRRSKKSTPVDHRIASVNEDLGLQVEQPQQFYDNTVPNPNVGKTEPLGADEQGSHSVIDNPALWFSGNMLCNVKMRNRANTRKVRANMTEEQRERERERNRERQRIKRLLQTPEERAAYTEKQRMERRRQRQDPSYRERERERQKARKKQMREHPWYRVRERELSRRRKVRKTSYGSAYGMDMMAQQCVDDDEETSQDGSFVDADNDEICTKVQELGNPVQNQSHKQQIYRENYPGATQHSHMKETINAGIQGAAYSANSSEMHFPELFVRGEISNQQRGENSSFSDNLEGKDNTTYHEDNTERGGFQNMGSQIKGDEDSITYFDMDERRNAQTTSEHDPERKPDEVKLGKISSSVFGVHKAVHMHRITPLNK